MRLTARVGLVVVAVVGAVVGDRLLTGDAPAAPVGDAIVQIEYHAQFPDSDAGVWVIRVPTVHGHVHCVGVGLSRPDVIDCNWGHK